MLGSATNTVVHTHSINEAAHMLADQTLDQLIHVQAEERGRTQLLLPHSILVDSEIHMTILHGYLVKVP